MPSYDPARTQLLERLPPRRLLRLVGELPRTEDGDLLRSRRRVEDLLRGGPWMREAAARWSTYLYVRGAEGPPEPYMIHPPRAIVFALFGDTVLFLETLSPAGNQMSTPEGQQQEEELLRIAQWGCDHLPELPRKGKIHAGMPGAFYMLGAHPSYAAGARHQVQQFRPAAIDEGEFQCVMANVRRISEHWQEQLRDVHQTEHARQAALRENLLTPYAQYKEVLDATHLGNQHGFCMSMANKTAAIHGGENFGQYNSLHFSAPPRIKQLLQAGP